MKTISIWAQSHRLQAILCLILLQTTLLSLYFCAGVFLFVYEVTFPPETSYIGMAVFLIACLLYPFKGVNKGWFKYTYKKAKSLQAVVLLSSIILICNIGNQLARSSMIISTDINYELRPVVLGPKINQKKQKKKTRKERRLERRKLKKQFRAFVKKVRKERVLTNGDIATIIFAGIFFTIIFGWFILSLYCNLACSGQASLAVMVLMAGTILWILGLVGLFRWVKNSRLKAERKRKEGVPDPG